MGVILSGADGIFAQNLLDVLCKSSDQLEVASSLLGVGSTGADGIFAQNLLNILCKSSE